MSAIRAATLLLVLVGVAQAQVDTYALPPRLLIQNADVPNKYRAQPTLADTLEDKAPAGKCQLEIDVLWRNDIGSGVLGSPLVGDVMGLFENQVAVASHRYYVELLDGDDGHPMPGWPYIADQKEFIAAPVLVDVNFDGVEEIACATTSGEILFFSPSGNRLLSNTYQLPKLAVHTDWAEGLDAANASATFSLFDHRPGSILSRLDYYNDHYYRDYDYMYGDKPFTTKPPVPTERPKYVMVDAHILATPIVQDLNEDGKDEMIVPVTYYFDREVYADPAKRERLGPNIDILQYVACGLLVIDLKSATVTNSYPLDLTTARSQWPAYLVSSPTIADVDGDGQLDFVVGTSVGFLYVFDQTGQMLQNFPVTMDEIHTQVLVADVFNDRRMHLVAADRSGNIVLFNSQAEEIWETRVIGYPSEAMMLGDINSDGILEVIIGTHAGILYIVNSQTGKPFDGFPIRLSAPTRAPPNLVALGKEPTDFLTVVIPTTDGAVHLVNPSGCIDRIDIGARVYSRVLADNVSNRGKMDLVVATADGEVVCLATEAAYHPLKSTTPASMSPTPYRYNYQGIFVSPESRSLLHVTGRSLMMAFDIVDQRPIAQVADYIAVYRVKVFIAGSNLLFEQTYNKAGHYVETVFVPNERLVGTVRLEMINELHQVFYDTFTLGFNVYFYRVLKWLLVVPLVGMSAALVFAQQLSLPDLPLWQ